MFLRRLSLVFPRISVRSTFTGVCRNFHPLSASRFAQVGNASLHATKGLFSRNISACFETKSSDHVVTLGTSSAYKIVLDSKTHALSLLTRNSLKVVAQASFSYVREEEIALLSSVKSDRQEHKEILLELLQHELAKKRADLFYFDSDLSLVKNLDQSHYDANVMVLSERQDLSKMKVKPLEGLVADKEKLLDNLGLLKKFLLNNSYWAKNEGITGLNEEMLANRINESTFTLAIIDPKDGCRGFVSYFTNGEIGYLYNTVIHEDDRGKGLGKALIHNLLQRIPENQTVFLITATDGPSIVAARKMYEQFGFQALSEHPQLSQLAVVKDIPQQEVRQHKKLC